MEANRSRARWSYAEFARLPTSGSTRYEIIDDHLVVTPAPGRRHQRISLDLATLMNTFVKEHDLGELYAAPFDVLFAEGDYLEPDLVFVHRDRLHLLSDRGLEGAPDLVIEILSPSTAQRDRDLKLRRYRHFRVPEYWIVDPELRAFEVWRLADGVQRPDLVPAGHVMWWQPDAEGTTLAIDVGELLPG